MKTPTITVKIIEKFLKDAKADNVINSVMYDKLIYRVQFYKENTKPARDNEELFKN